MKRFFYEFSGNVFLEVNDQTEAEKLVTDISLDNYLIDEELFEIDEDYIAYDLKRREEKLGTYFHPVNDPDEFEEFKIRNCRYGNIFKQFLNGQFDKDELIKRMAQAEKENLDDCDLFSEISMFDIEGKNFKRVRHVTVD